MGLRESVRGYATQDPRAANGPFLAAASPSVPRIRAFLQHEGVICGSVLECLATVELARLVRAGEFAGGCAGSGWWNLASHKKYLGRSVRFSLDWCSLSVVGGVRASVM